MTESSTAAGGEEGTGSSEMEMEVGCADIIIHTTTSSDSLDSSLIFHLLIDILGFVLFMHHQIPSVLPDLCLEFDALQNEYKDLEETLVVSQGAEMKASLRREHVWRKRELKQGIRRLEKLITTIANFKIALQLLITEAPHIQRLALVLGPSPSRPLHLYELSLSHDIVASADLTRTKLAEGLSRKVIRTLISKGAGSDRDSGPSKLFLLVEAPSSLNLPLHFLPKRDFKYNSKILPFKLQFMCRNKLLESNAQWHDNQNDGSMLMNSMPDDNIWFMCRHVIKGLASKSLSSEE